VLRGAVDVDKYYREAKDAARKMPLDRLVGVSNEALRQHPGVPLGGTLYPIPLAGALFMAACGSEELDGGVAVLFGYSYAPLAGGKPLDAAVLSQLPRPAAGET